MAAYHITASYHYRNQSNTVDVLLIHIPSRILKEFVYIDRNSNSDSIVVLYDLTRSTKHEAEVRHPIKTV
jgi:hypothetical protein